MGSPVAEAARFDGWTPPPEAEGVDGHVGVAGEASPSVLRNRAATAPPVAPSQEGRDRAAPVAGELVQIVRATTRIRLAVWRMPKDERKSVYQRLRTARWRVAMAMNTVARAYQRLDEDALDAWMTAHGGQLPRLKDWPPPQLKSWGYPLVRQAVPELASGIASSCAKAASNKWRQQRWDALIRQTVRPVRYTIAQPIPVRAQDYRLEEAPSSVELSLSLESGTGNRFAIPLELRDERQREDVARLISGEWKCGELRVEEDSRRPGRWYVRLAYKRMVAKRHGGVAAAINRGIRWFLVGVTDAGDRWQYPGTDIRDHLRQIQERRKEYQRCSLASGRSGRGRKRILRPTKPLIEAGERWRKTKCQTIARRFAQWLRDRRVTLLYVEDFTGIRDGEPERLKGGERIYRMVQEWPYYQLQMRLESCCAEYGIEVRYVDPEYISQTCPVCGSVAEEHRDLGRWMLRCECGYREHLDAAAARNVLARGEAVRLEASNDSTGVAEKKGGSTAAALAGSDE